MRFGDPFNLGGVFGQGINVYITGPIPNGATLVVLRTQGNIIGLFVSQPPAAGANLIAFANGLVRLDAFLVSDMTAFLSGDISVVIAEATWRQ